MQLDIRLPMGLLFLLLGVILVVYGFISDPAIYVTHSLGQNVNLHWGLVFAAFGTAMLWLTRRARKRAATAAAATPDSPTKSQRSPGKPRGI
jgi:membrane protein implicated in regulation of membrane protease activity